MRCLSTSTLALPEMSVSLPSTFTFPQIFHFPPFFTRQSHEGTWLKQRKMWSDLILSYGEAKRLFELDFGAESTLSTELFFNSQIDRKMDKQFLSEIVAFMCENKLASKLGNNRVVLLWRTPVQWAQAIHQWVASVGGLGSIYTVYELIEGDDTRQEVFHGIPESLCRIVVAELERSGKAKLISTSPSSSLLESGLKFI